jgi:hypothetical protein
MAKRFTATEIWGEDWFLAMPIEYKLFWFYMLANCDHGGLFKVNLKSYCGLNEVKVTTTDALKYFNDGKDRIRIINASVWYVEDFFVFQYGTTFNVNNRLHASIQKLYEKLGIELNSIRGVLDLIDGVKDKDKDKLYSNKNEKNGKSVVNFKAQPEELMLKRLNEGLSKRAIENGGEDSSGQT